MSFSEGYQKFLDKINERIPIKVITKPIDKIHPLASFFLLIIIILLVLYFTVFSGGSNTPEYQTYIIKLADNKGEILKNFSFKIINTNTGIDTEYQTDNSGKKEITLDSSGDYEFVVEKKGYYKKTLYLDPSKTEYKIMLETFELPDVSTKVLSFVDKDTHELITNDQLNVRFKCENGTEITPDKVHVENGKYTLNDISVNCGSLLATVDGNNYYSQAILIPETESVVNVPKRNIVTDYGEVKIFVKNNNDWLSGITVRIYKADDLVNPITTKTSSGGAVRFNNLVVGDYKAVASDSVGNYLSSDVEFTIIKDSQIQATINMQSVDNNPDQNSDQNQSVETRTINVILKEEGTNIEISSVELNPIITLLEDGNQTIDIKSYTSNGISFVVDKTKSFSIKADALGYIPKVKTITSDIDNYTIYLEKITVSNVSKINANIYDEDNLPVANANVFICVSGIGIDPRFTPEITDSNGNVTFNEIPDGNYYLLVRKVFLEGTSEQFTHDAPNDSNITVPVEVGKGTINLIVKNTFGDVVQDSLVTLYTEQGTLIGSDYVNISGIFNKQVKADKKVYAVISKSDYVNYYTEIIPIHKNQTTTKQVILSREYIGDYPNINYLGVFNTEGEKVDYLSQNKVYYFKFLLTNPSSSDSMGFVFRIGANNNVNDNKEYIKPLENLNKGIPSYYAEYPFNNLVPEGAKANLVNIDWSNIDSGVYELTIPVRVLTALKGTVIPIKYKAYKSSSGDYLVNPETQETISTKQDLFIKPTFNQEQYYIDVDSLCNDVFCFSGQYIDIEKDLIYDIDSSPINTLVNSEYKLIYSITNSKNKEYLNPRLYIENIDPSTSQITQAINIKSYDISGPFNKIESDSIQQHFKIPFSTEEYLSSDKISPYEEIKVNSMIIKPLYLGQSKIKHTIVSDQHEIYNYNLDFVTQNLHTMNIEYTPENIVPGIPIDLEITLKDDQGNPVSNANINISEIINGNPYTVVTGKLTGTDGKVIVSLPKLNLGEKIIINADKPTYHAEPITIEVKQDILDPLYNNNLITTDSPLEINVHKDNINGNTETITLRNKTSYPLTLNRFTSEDLSFVNSNLLSLGKTLTSLNSKVDAGFTIEPNSEKELEIKIAPSQDALNLVESEYLDGVIKGHVSYNSITYPFDISIKAQISVGDGVDNDNCLIATGYSDPWKTVISGNGSQEITFTIVNNCMSKDNPEQPVTLKNIRAKIMQEGDKYGYYDLTIDNSSKRLSQGVYKTITTGIEPGRTYVARLKYNSSGTKFGDIKTKIYLNGQIETENGLKYVNNGEGEILLNTEFSILQIADCIKFYDSGKEINNMFVIESDILGNNVGSKELTLKNTCADKGRFKVSFSRGFYKGSEGLKYGNMTGPLENEVKFNFGEADKVVDIYKPEIPGAYTILVTISALDNQDAVEASVVKKLKLNVKGAKLYMEDPFLEVHIPDEGTPTTNTVKLLNRDINKTPWDYATRRVAGDDGFSKVMSKNFDKENINYKNIKFESLLNLENSNYGGDLDSGWYQAGGSVGAAFIALAAVAAITATTTGASIAITSSAIVVTAATTTAGLGGFGAALLAIPVYGWIAIGVITAGCFFVNTMENDYDWDIDLKYVDVPKLSILPSGESTKIISINNINNSNNSEAAVSVFDITGIRYITYLNGYGHGAGKLVNDETLKMQIPKCYGMEHRLPFGEYHYIAYSENCENTFNSFEETDNSYKYTVKCNGAWLFGRKKMKLKANTYMSCKYDEEIWPEQAGIKPLKFKLDNNASAEIKSGDNFYKTITFKPTLDDSEPENIDANPNNYYIDPAFEGAEAIGKYRFEFHPAYVQETPNIDLNITPCFTDSDKIGVTGPGAVPNINFDWEWNSLDNIDKCTNNYCDATQLTQVILNRINKAKTDYLEKNSISCPKSIEQIADDAQSGSYKFNADPSGITNEVPLGKTGIEEVKLSTDGDLFKVKVVIENRTGMALPASGTLNINLEDQELKTVTYLQVDEDNESAEYVDDTINQYGNYSKSILVPSGDDDTREYIFTYGSEGNRIIADDLDLNITYIGPSVEYGVFNTVVDLNTAQGSNFNGGTNCEVPATTLQFNGIDYIDYWFNQNQYQESVQSPWNSQDINNFKNLLHFKAKLITDNYNQNFLNDFDKAFGGAASADEGLGIYSFMGAPQEYQDKISQLGYLSYLVKNHLQYYQKYSSEQDGVKILTPGLYDVRIDLLFGNDRWKFINDSQKIDANVIVTFTYLKGPDSQSVFYRLPFDGFVGYSQEGYNRQNYGLAYLGDKIKIAPTYESSTDYIETSYDNGSNPLKYLNITKEDDFFKLNSDIETRGNILTINKENNGMKMVFSPSIATPILMKVNRKAIQPFNIYYQLVDESSKEPVYGGNSLTRWDGVGDGLDYSGDYVYSVFNSYYDNVTTQADRIPNAYKIEWPIVNYRGNVYLRTIFYTPPFVNYNLRSKISGSDPSISFNNGSSDNFTTNIKINGSSSDKIKTLQDIFEKVRENKVCVTNSSDGLRSEFWWNPEAIYSVTDKFTGEGLQGISS